MVSYIVVHGTTVKICKMYKFITENLLGNYHFTLRHFGTFSIKVEIVYIFQTFLSDNFIWLTKTFYFFCV